jgi:hypothetical protein
MTFNKKVRTIFKAVTMVVILFTFESHPTFEPVFTHDHLIERTSKKFAKDLKSIVNIKDSIYSQDLKNIYNMFQLDLLKQLLKQKKESGSRKAIHTYREKQ